MSHKTTLVTITSILVLMAFVILGIRFFSGEDNWICQNGQWVRHGNPRSLQPSSKCGADLPDEEKNEPEDQEKNSNPENETAGDDIKIIKPVAGGAISSPLEITGEARGVWFFEASFPIKLLSEDGKEIATGHAEAMGDWMTEEFIPFRAIFEFDAKKMKSGTLIFSQDNPSGLAENNKEVKVPVTFETSQNTKIKVYFNNSNKDPDEGSCEHVLAVDRIIPRTPKVGAATLGELLKGPTDVEARAGYTTNINPGVELKSLTITSGIAKADFSSRLNSDVAGSCRVNGIKEQINQTLKQFPAVREVVISVEGKTGEILQP
jgi:hypothetical protein